MNEKRLFITRSSKTFLNLRCNSLSSRSGARPYYLYNFETITWKAIAVGMAVPLQREYADISG
jgi:hypothetical protein